MPEWAAFLGLASWLVATTAAVVRPSAEPPPSVVLLAVITSVWALLAQVA